MEKVMTAHLQLAIDVNEFAALARASNRFNVLASVLHGTGRNTRAFDMALTDLQRLRELLEKFSPIAHAAKSKSPVEVLDFMAKKLFPDIATFVAAEQLCTNAAQLLSGVLEHVLNQIKFGPAQPPVQIDPRKLH